MTLDEWIIYGQVGISSKTMWAALKGIKIEPTYGDKPYDPGDFSRCYRLAKQCELSKQDLSIITEKLPYWQPYIDNWDKLCKMYEDNKINNWKTHEEIGMYDFMQKLREESDKIKYSK
ncbi:MAG: hypothetical protein K9J21_12565 [Bacteroidales bacterium]|nr:hypothetical protein [Bacteroidales bacterium]